MRTLAAVVAAACLLVSVAMTGEARDPELVIASNTLALQPDADLFGQMGLLGDWQYDPEGVEERMEETFNFLTGLFIICGIFVVVYLVCKYNNEKH
jgi:hypothetical protein